MCRLLVYILQTFIFHVFSKNTQDLESTCFKIPLFQSNVPRDSYLIVDYFYMNQPGINEVMANYSRLRDLHTSPPYFAAHVHMNLVLADALNASLVAHSNLISDYQNCSNKIISKFLFQIPGKFVHELQAFFWKSKSAKFIPVDAMSLNFVYCDKPKKSKQSPFQFNTFLNTADTYVWLCLLAAIFCISGVLSIGSHFDKTKYQLSICESTLTTLSALLSPGISATVGTLHHSGIFTLWTCVCLVFVTFYSGFLTSVVISPVPENTMKQLGDLITNAFSLANWDRATLMALQLLKKGSQYDNIEKEKLEALFNSSQVVTTSEEFFQILLSGKKRAAINNDITVLHFLSRLNYFMKEWHIKDLRCHIGKTLDYQMYSYTVFIPPESDMLAEVFQATLENGMHQFWLSEMKAVAISKRVQDRLRVVIPTHVVQEKEKVAGLKLEGKLVVVFVLWAFLLVICCGAFTFEVMLMRSRSRMVVGY